MSIRLNRGTLAAIAAAAGIALAATACSSAGSAAISGAVGSHSAQAQEAKATFQTIVVKLKTDPGGKDVVEAFNSCAPFTVKGADLNNPQPGRVEFLLQNPKKLPGAQQGPYAKESAHVVAYFGPHPIAHSKDFASCTGDNLPLSDPGKKAQAKACIKGKATSAFHLGMHVVDVINTLVNISVSCYDTAAGLHPTPAASASGSASARAPSPSTSATSSAAALGDQSRWDVIA